MLLPLHVQFGNAINLSHSLFVRSCYMACLFQSSIHIYLLLHLVGIVDASGSQMRLVVRTWSWATLPELFLVRIFLGTFFPQSYAQILLAFSDSPPDLCTENLIQ